MPDLVSLLQLRTRVREAADIENATARFPDSEVNDKINRAMSSWYDLIVATPWGGDTYYSSYTFNTQGNVSQYPMPSDWLHIQSIDVFIQPGQNSNQVISAKPFQTEFRNAFKFWSLTWNYSHPIYYQVQGQNLALIPTPPASFSIGINYIPVAPYFTGGANSVSIVGGGSGGTSNATVALKFTGGQKPIPVISAGVVQSFTFGSAATGTATFSSAGAIASVTITSPGSGYVAPPVVTLTPQMSTNLPTGYSLSASLAYDDSQTLDVINGWDEALILAAAVKCLTKDGDAASTDLAILQGQLAQETARIRQAAGVRDRNRAELVHDLETEIGPWDWG